MKKVNISFQKDSIEHNHKKRKDSLEGSLGRVLFSAEHEFPKILVPRLPQNTSNVNIESTGKSKRRLYYLCGQLLEALIYLHFSALILILLFYCSLIVLILILLFCF